MSGADDRPLSTPSHTTLVFVYGSLKRGQRNHRLLASARFVGEAKTEKRFRLWATPHYPALVRDAADPLEILGEVYEIDAAMLRRLDTLEDNGRLYLREQLPIELLDPPGEFCQAWTYIWLGSTHGLERWFSDRWPGPVE